MNLVISTTGMIAKAIAMAIPKSARLIAVNLNALLRGGMNTTATVQTKERSPAPQRKAFCFLRVKMD